MESYKKKMQDLIRDKKLKGSIRKPKYATRKLSIGLVSCMLGFSLIVGSLDVWAAEPASAASKTETTSTEPSLGQTDAVSAADQKPGTEQAGQEEKQGENAKDLEKDLSSLKEEAKAKIESEIKEKDENLASDESKALLDDYIEKIDKVENKEDLDALLADFEKAMGDEKDPKKDENTAREIKDRSSSDGENLEVSPKEEKDSQGAPNPDANVEKETKKEEIKENWEAKPVDKSRWAVGENQRIVRVTTSDPVEMSDIDYDGAFVDGNGDTVIRLVYKEKSAATSAVWYRSLINFGDLTDKIDFEKSYVLGRDGKTQYKFEEFAAGGGYMFDIGKAAGDRTTNRKNLPINIVLKDGKTIKDLGDKNIGIQMRLTDVNGERIYAYAPGKTSIDYSTYTKTTSISLNEKINNLFMKGGLQSDSNNATNQEFFMSEFIANPKSYSDSSNLGLIRTQYMGQRSGLASTPKVGGEEIGFTQVFDANLVNYLKEDGQGNVGYVNLMTAGRVDSPYAKNFAIKKSDINYSADGKLAYIVIGTPGYKKDGVKVVEIPQHDQYTMLQGIYITAIDYVVDKSEFANTFDKNKTKKLDYSMMSGWTNPNKDGWTLYEKTFDEDFVVKEGGRYIIDTGDRPLGEQIMVQIGDEVVSLNKKYQGYYNGYVSGKGAVDSINQVKNGAIPVPGLYEVILREGVSIKAGQKLKLYMPYSKDHTKPVGFSYKKNGSATNEGGADISMRTDRDIDLHIFRKDNGYYKLTYTPKGATEPTTLEFRKVGGLIKEWQASGSIGVVKNGLKKSSVAAGGNYILDTSKIEPGTKISVEVFDEKGNQEDKTSYLNTNLLDKSENKYTDISWTDHSDTSSILSINKSLYKPYQEIFTNDTVADSTDDTYKDPRKLVSEEDFKKDTTKIDGYTKYEGGKVRVEFKDGSTNKVSKTEADSNEYDDKGNIVGTDQRIDFKFDENGEAYHVFKYQMDLKDATAARSTEQSQGEAPKLYKDMKLVFNASDGSSLPSDDVIARVRTRILFNATDGKVEGKDSIVKIAPDNKKFYGEEGYVANGFRGDNVEEGTGDQFVADPTSSNSKLKFLGWVTEDGKKALGDKTTVKSSVFKTLKGDQIFTADTPILRHQIVYAIWAEEQVVKFDANGGAFDDGKREEINVIGDEGGTTVPTEPKQDGKKFKGWADENGKILTPEDIAKLDGTTKLIAQWEDKSPDEQPKDETPPASPSITAPEDGNIKIAPPSDEDTKTVDVTYTKPDGSKGSITATKDENGNWTLPADAPAGSKIDPNSGVITIPTSEIKGGTDVNATASDASNNTSGPASKRVADKEKYDLQDPAATKVDDPTKLSQTEKDEIIGKVKEKNSSLPEGTKIDVDNEGNVTITYPDKTTATIGKDKTVEKKTDTEKYDPVNPTDKVKINKAGDLSDEEKKDVKKAVEEANKDKFPAGTEISVDNDGEVKITYPDGTIDTIPGKDAVEEKTYTEKIDPINPDVTKVNNPSDLSDEEKDAVKKAVEAKNTFPNGTKIEVGDDGTVTIKYPDGSTDTIDKSNTVAEDTALKVEKPEKTKVGNTDSLTPEEQKAVKDAIKDKNPSLTDEQITVDDKGNVTIKVGNKIANLSPADTISQDDKLLVNDPAITPVDNPNELSQADKDKVIQAIKDANPDLSKEAEITVDANGKVTIKDGKKTATIKPEKTVKPKTDAEKNPLTDPEKTKVNNPYELTQTEKNDVIDAVKKANDKLPADANITVDEKGNVTVTFKDGSELKIDGKKTVKKKPDNERVNLTDPAKTPVDNPESLTTDEQDKVKKAVEDANNLPNGSDVSVDSTGKVTITYPDGSTAQITPDKTVEAEFKDPAKTLVQDPNALADDEKAAIKKEILKANPGLDPDKVAVDEKGNVTITKADDSTKVIPADKTLSSVKLPEKTEVGDANKLTDTEKKTIKDKFEKENPTLNPDVFVVKDDGSVEVHKNGNTTVIPAEKVVESAIKNPEKTLVNDPTNLTDEEKLAIRKAINKANPTVKDKDISIGDDGTVTIGKGDGAKTIPADKVIRTDVKAPVKTSVKDPNSLTKAEKDAIKEAIKNANPDLKDSDITINEDGSADVYKDGETTKITADQTTAPTIKNPDPTIVKDKNNLSDEDREKIKEAVKLANKDLTDDQITVNKDGSVTIRKKGEIPQTIPADKTVVGDVKAPEITEVNDPNNLSEDDKDKIKEAIKKANTDLTDEEITVNDDGSVTVKKDGKEIKIPAEKTITSTIKNPDPTIVEDTNKLSEHEKSMVEEAVRKANPDLKDDDKVEVADNGEVTITRDGKKTTIPAEKTVSQKFNTPDRTLVQYPNNLSDEEKAAVKEAVKKANSGLKDDQIEVQSDGAVVITDSNGKKSTIPGSNTVGAEVKAPALTTVKDKNKLSDEEKEQVKKALKKTNPDLDLGTVTVHDDGSVTVEIHGKKLTYPSEKVVRQDILAPEKTEVADPNKISEDEKEKIKKAVEDANPGIDKDKITVNEDGSVTIDQDGKKVTIPAVQTITSAIKNPEPTRVNDPNKLTDEDKDKIRKAIRKANPGLSDDTKIDVDDKGNVSFTVGGKKHEIPSNATLAENAKLPAKTKEFDKTKLKQDEIDAIRKAIEDANNFDLGTQVVVEENGKVTITYPDGSKESLSIDDLAEEKDKPETPAKTQVEDPSKLSPAEQAEVKNAIEDKNKGKDFTVKVDEKGNATITYPDGTQTQIDAKDLVEKKKSDDTNPENPGTDHNTDPNPGHDGDDDTDTKPGDQGSDTTDGKQSDTDSEKADDEKDSENEKTDDKAGHDKENAKAKVPEVKTPVKDADHLTDEEKAKVAENVKKANPDATNITVDDKGNAKIEYADQSAESIPAKNLVYQVEKGSVAIPAKSDKENAKPAKSKNSDVASARNRQSANVKTGVESISGVLATLGAAISGLVATKKKKEDK